MSDARNPSQAASASFTSGQVYLISAALVGVAVVAAVALGKGPSAGKILAANDPAAPGSAFPQCVFRTSTGLWCPGCGLTRGFHQLFNGHVLSALHQNVFVPLVVVAVVAAWWSWVRDHFKGPV